MGHWLALIACSTVEPSNKDVVSNWQLGQPGSPCSRATEAAHRQMAICKPASYSQISFGCFRQYMEDTKVIYPLSGQVHRHLLTSKSALTLLPTPYQRECLVTVTPSPWDRWWVIQSIVCLYPTWLDLIAAPKTLITIPVQGQWWPGKHEKAPLHHTWQTHSPCKQAWGYDKEKIIQLWFIASTMETNRIQERKATIKNGMSWAM